MTPFEAALAAPDLWLAVTGLVIGFAFGALIAATNYCTLGAVSDWRLGGDKGRIGAVALAAATAILGSQLSQGLGWVDLSKSIYLAPRLSILAPIGGGLMFGVGMVYAGGCPSRVLARAGGGDIRALITLLVVALTAYAALSGILARGRMTIQNMAALDLANWHLSNQSLTEVFKAIGVAPQVAPWLAPSLVAFPLIVFASRALRTPAWPVNAIAGLGVGVLATLAWTATGLASDELAANPIQPASLSFVRPVADAIDWIERATALGLPGFAAASVFGTLLGSFATAAVRGTLSSGGFVDRRDLRRHLGGAAAMGIGGVLGLGCSIGQGIAGVSTLSLQSFLAAGSILAGIALGLRRLERDLES